MNRNSLPAEPAMPDITPADDDPKFMELVLIINAIIRAAVPDTNDADKLVKQVEASIRVNWCWLRDDAGAEIWASRLSNNKVIAYWQKRGHIPAAGDPEFNKLIAVAQSVIDPNVKDFRDAEELVSDVSLKICLHWYKLQNNPLAEAWTRKVSRRKVIDHWRKKGAKLPDNFLGDEDVEDPDLGSPPGLGGDLGDCKEQLPGNWRRALELRFEGWTYQEIADEMKVPLGTVFGWIQRAFAQLRLCMTEKGYGPTND